MNDQPMESRSDEEAPDIEDLLDPFLDRAYGFCLRLTGNRQDAEDLVQDAALKACRGFSTYQPGTNFKAWFFKIIVNAFRERFRRRRPEHDSVDFGTVPEAFLYSRAAELDLVKGTSDPAKALLSRIDTQLIEEALARLPEEFRVVCNMYFVEDFTYEEIAKMLDIPIGTVRSRLHRGRKLLQMHLWDVAAEHGIVPPREEEPDI